MPSKPLDIVRLRLANQHLTGPTLETAEEVVRTFGAVQAQDYSGAKWALAMRMHTGVDAEIEREINEGKILRTHVLRPTWHFIAPEDIRWMLALTGPRVRQAMGHYDRKIGLDDATYRKSHAAVTRALEGDNHLTRAELGEALTRARIPDAKGQRLAHLMARAELDALICSGARRGNQSTYALVDERVPAMPARDRDESLLELTRRYFTTRGPASARDFSWWSGLTMADVKRGVEIAGNALQRVVIDDEPFWLVERALPRQRPSTHLLPNYDEYFIGFKDRSAIGKRMGHVRSVTGGDAFIAHVIAIDGQLVGGWKRRIEKGTVVVDVNIVTPVTTAERKRIDTVVASFARFLRLPLASTS
jgi:hypothetical protein